MTAVNTTAPLAKSTSCFVTSSLQVYCALPGLL
jgi:hypothetical protein